MKFLPRFSIIIQNGKKFTTIRARQRMILCQISARSTSLVGFWSYKISIFYLAVKPQK